MKRFRKPEARAALSLGFLLGILLLLHYGTSVGSEVVGVVGVVGGWAIAFLTAHWNMQVAHVESARAAAYRELGALSSAAALAGARLGVAIRREVEAESFFAKGPVTDILMPGKFNDEWDLAYAKFLEFHVLWLQSDLLFQDAAPLYGTLYRELDSVHAAWQGYHGHLIWFITQSAGTTSERERHRDKSRAIADQLQCGVQLIIGFQRELQTTTFEPMVGASGGLHPGQTILREIHSTLATKPASAK